SVSALIVTDIGTKMRVANRLCFGKADGRSEPFPAGGQLLKGVTVRQPEQVGLPTGSRRSGEQRREHHLAGDGKKNPTLLDQARGKQRRTGAQGFGQTPMEPGLLQEQSNNLGTAEAIPALDSRATSNHNWSEDTDLVLRAQKGDAHAIDQMVESFR